MHALQGTSLAAIYHDDPEATPLAGLRSDAAIVVPAGTNIPRELTPLVIPAGTYAITTHVGPYQALGDAWARLMGEWLPRSGRRVGDGVSYEIDRNTPATAKSADLLTDLVLALA